MGDQAPTNGSEAANPSAARRAREMVSGSPLLTQVAESAWSVAQKGLRPRKLSRYLESTDSVRLMIGSGPSKVEGWLSTDILPSRPDVMLLDATKDFPIESGTVDRIHSEHMIEHVDHPHGRTMLAECFRVLKPGGRIRLATPDLDRVLALTGTVDPEVTEMMVRSNERHGIVDERSTDPIYSMNRLFSGYGHRFLYTEPVLRREMEAAGFIEIERFDVGASNDPEFTEVERHGEQIEADWNRYQTLVLEATKPA